MKTEAEKLEDKIIVNKKRLMWYTLFIVTLFVSLLVIYLKYLKSQDEIVLKNDEILAKNEVIEKQIEELSSVKNKVYKQIDSLSNTINYLYDKNDSLTGIISKKKNISKKPSILLQKYNRLKKIEIIKNSEYLIGLHSYKAEEEDNNKIESYLKKEGYTIDSGFHRYNDSSLKPSWMANSSTVFYYSSSSKEKAERIAKKVSSLTDKAYKLKRGSGYGVIKGQEKYTFFIHNIN